jgi:hypothetical protein
MPIVKVGTVVGIIMGELPGPPHGASCPGGFKGYVLM